MVVFLLDDVEWFVDVYECGDCLVDLFGCMCGVYLCMDVCMVVWYDGEWEVDYVDVFVE